MYFPISNRFLKAKRIVALFALVFLSVAPAFSQTEQLRIMTFNVPKGNITTCTWAERAAALHEFLNSTSPDLLGMQEPVVSSLTDVLAGIPGYAMLGVARDDGKQSGEYSPIIYKTARFTVEHTGTYWLSLTPTVVSKNWESNCNRVATWAIFRDKASGARFLYTNTHLDHVSAEARYYQMRVIKEQMKSIFDTYGEMPAFLTGDLNSNGSESTYNPINEAKTYLTPMNDSYAVKKTHHGITYTFPSGKQKIDYVLVTKDVQVSDTYIHNSIIEADGLQLSDHNAHYADVSWNLTLENKTAALLTASQNLLDSLLVFSTTTDELVTDAASQLSGDGIEAGSSFANLIDNKITSVYISRYTTTPLPGEGTHYLQADLGESGARAFDMVLNPSTSQSYKNHAPSSIRVYASADSEQWQYVCDVSDIDYGKINKYISSVIALPQNMRYVRFEVLRTSAMDITVSAPHFILAEFQLRSSTLDEANSQRYYNSEMKVACDTLAQRMAAARQSATEANYAGLESALEAVRSLYIPTNEYNSLLDECSTLASLYTVGSKLGQVSTEAKEAFNNGVSAVKESLPAQGSKTDYEEAISKLHELISQFKSSVVYFTEGKWFYLVNKAKVSTGTTRSRILYVAKADVTAPLLAERQDSLGVVLRGSKSPYAMWRFVEIDGEKHTYALQNRGTGYYLGLTDADNGQCYTSSLLPVAFTPLFTAAEVFSLSAPGNDGQYISATTDGPLYDTAGGSATSASWGVEEVADTMQYIQIPVKENSIIVKCLPYAVEGVSASNEGMKAYAINSVASILPYVYLEQRDNFAAGEPFILMVGNPALASDDDKTIMMNVKSQDELVTEPLAANGLVGVLTAGKAPAGMFFDNNYLRNRTSTSTIAGQSGYIIRSQAKATGNDIDLTITANTIVNGIRTVKAMENGEAKFFTIEGVEVKDAGNLEKGIYIINGQKVLVK